MDWKLFATVFATVFLAELGDKTQIATFMYAAGELRSRVVVFAAAAAALVLATALAVLAGSTLAEHLNPRWMGRIAGGGLVLVGVWIFAHA